jgi:hypothetical protein
VEAPVKKTRGPGDTSEPFAHASGKEYVVNARSISEFLTLFKT